MDTSSAQTDFDIVIAGGGAAGILAAARLALALPQARIALLEKDPILGGRLRGTNREAQVFGYGLNAASDALYQFWRQTFLEAEADSNVEFAADRRQQRVGVLSGNKISEVEIDQWFTAKGARMLGGMVAAREWGDVEEALLQNKAVTPETTSTSTKSTRKGASKAVELSSDPDGAIRETENAEEIEAAQATPKAAKAQRKGASKATKPTDDDDSGPENDGDDVDEAENTLDQPVSHLWKRNRKAASGEVLEHFASAFGIPDVWAASANALAERARYYASGLYAGNWDEAIRQLVDREWFKKSVTILVNTRVVTADFNHEVWTLATDAGSITGRSLIVAQPPWQAMAWLKRAQWPAQLLHVASKTKPVSVVVLSEYIETPELSIPDVLIVPSERAQIVRNGPKEIAFQATIDFELSMQAPAVVKAVRSLKRARKKLLNLYPGSISETGHIALIPVAWAQPPSQSEKRWLIRATKKPINSPTLAFCGDAYGDCYDGDANVIKSLLAACTAVSKNTNL